MTLKKQSKISVLKSDITTVILTHNNQDTIGATLNSIYLVGLNNVIVIDSGSSDLTHSICDEYDVRFITNKFISFPDQRQFGLQKVNTKYCLMLDSDELLRCVDESIQAKDSLCVEMFDKNSANVNVCNLQRLNYLSNTFLSYTYPDAQPRLLCKANVTYQSNKIVHEIPSIKPSSRLVDLYIVHHMDSNPSVFLEKTIKYAYNEATSSSRMSNRSLLMSLLKLLIRYMSKQYNPLNPNSLLWLANNILYEVLVSYYQLNEKSSNASSRNRI